ncbi:LuxR family transcriptional regulator [Sphingomonas colocasiae]|uniref:LuxR family transcriptional regulator n=2 Tax=Sphingomonas colocasiae TaxID=1848973 RepID=A0ABS7PPW5_9SPHN|nr:LuxR family transcriptional regulator [Sphingomonas colocasiae]
MACLAGFAERANRVADLVGLAGLVAEMARDLGFAHHALAEHGEPADGCLFLHDYPGRWADAFIARAMHRFDPVRQAAARRVGGFGWRELPRLVTLEPCQRAMMSEACDIGLGEGFTVPLHAPGMRVASCSFVCPPGEPLPRHALPAAECLAYLAFGAAHRLLGVRWSRPRLTARQRQCVALVSQGKTDWEIGVILGLSEETVGKYLDAARMRFGVARRTQLVAAALVAGEIGADPAEWL